MNNRMSAIGITVIEDGKIADEYYSLGNPESRFDSFNTRLTGISGKTVWNAPAFPEVWKQIDPFHKNIFSELIKKRTDMAVAFTVTAFCFS